LLRKKSFLNTAITSGERNCNRARRIFVTYDGVSAHDMATILMTAALRMLFAPFKLTAIDRTAFERRAKRL